MAPCTNDIQYGIIPTVGLTQCKIYAGYGRTAGHTDIKMDQIKTSSFYFYEGHS